MFEYYGTDYRLIVDRHGEVRIIRRADGATTHLQRGDDAADALERVGLCAGAETVIEVDTIGNEYCFTARAGASCGQINPR